MHTRDSKKENIRQYADNKSCVKQYSFSIGDKVLVHNMNKGVTQPYYEKMPYIVISVKGNLVTAKRNEHKITRNATHFKKITSANDELDLDVRLDNGDNTPNNPVRSPIKTRSASGHVPKIPTKYMQGWITMDIRLFFFNKKTFTLHNMCMQLLT